MSKTDEKSWERLLKEEEGLNEWRELLDDEDQKLASENVQQRTPVQKPEKLLIAPGQIKEIRKDLGWSQRDLADALGCKNTQISRWESGRVSMSKNYYYKLKSIYVEYMEVDSHFEYEPFPNDKLAWSDSKVTDLNKYYKWAEQNKPPGGHKGFGNAPQGHFEYKKKADADWRKVHFWTETTVEDIMLQIEVFQIGLEEMFEEAKKEILEQKVPVKITVDINTKEAKEVLDSEAYLNRFIGILSSKMGKESLDENFSNKIKDALNLARKMIKEEYDDAAKHLKKRSLDKSKEIDHLKDKLVLMETNLELSQRLLNDQDEKIHKLQECHELLKTITEEKRIKKAGT